MGWGRLAHSAVGAWPWQSWRCLIWCGGWVAGAPMEPERNISCRVDRRRHGLRGHRLPLSPAASATKPASPPTATAQPATPSPASTAAISRPSSAAITAATQAATAEPPPALPAPAPAAALSSAAAQPLAAAALSSAATHVPAPGQLAGPSQRLWGAQARVSHLQRPALHHKRRRGGRLLHHSAHSSRPPVLDVCRRCRQRHTPAGLRALPNRQHRRAALPVHRHGQHLGRSGRCRPCLLDLRCLEQQWDPPGGCRCQPGAVHKQQRRRQLGAWQRAGGLLHRLGVQQRRPEAGGERVWWIPLHKHRRRHNLNGADRPWLPVLDRRGLLSKWQHAAGRCWRGRRHNLPLNRRWH